MTPDFKHRVEYKEYVEATQFSARITVLSVFVGAVFFSYLLAFYYLQVVEGVRYTEMAEANRGRQLVLAPPRGAILDRYSRLIARNRPAFDVVLDREHAARPEEALRLVAPALGTSVDDLMLALRKASVRPRHEPLVLASDVSLAVAAFVEARSADLPGISISMGMKRSYQEGKSGSHYLGYVGEIGKGMLDNPEFEGSVQGDIVGKTGVERAYNRELHGVRGQRRVVVNSGGRVMGDLAGSIPPVPGIDIRLTINLDMQRELDAAFGDMVGAGVFLDTRSGDVLAITSRPGYDPNYFARRFTRQFWKGLVEDPLKPLQNRAIQSGYSPGSTFKPVMAAAALEEGVAVPSTTIFCGGSGVFYGRRFLCHEKSGHGYVNMKQAIQVSCNVYFYTLGSRLGIDSVAKYAKLFGLGRRTGLDIANEAEGLVPTPEWKMKTHKDRWYPSETTSVSIGQGPLLVTPLQMAVAQGAIAMDGRRIRPRLRAGGQPASGAAEGDADVIGSRSLEVVRQAEWAVVNEWGTGTRAKIEGRDVCGKTGTAQVFAGSAGVKDEDLPPEMRDHAWFVGFAPLGNPRISFAVIVEHGGHGGTTAAPIVQRVLQKFFESEEKAPHAEPSAGSQVADAAAARAGNL